MKIAFICDRTAPFYLGGYEDRLWGFARRLARGGHDVSVLTTCDAVQVIDGVRFLNISRPRSYFADSGFRDLRHNMAYCYDLLRYLPRIEQFDIVDANATPWLHLPIARALAFRAGARFVITAHEALSSSMRSYFAAKRAPFANLQGWAAKQYYLKSQSLAEILIAASPSAISSLRSEGFRAPVVSAPSGQDVVPEAEIDFTPGVPMQVVFAGRHVPMKRIPVLLEAAARLRDVNFSILGDGPSGAELVSKARMLELDNVRFLGHVSEEEKKAALIAAEIFVMPSYREGWSLATVEAMAHGCAPVFAHKPDRYETGIATYVQAGRNGFEFDGSVEELVRVLTYLRDEPQARRRLREAAHSTSRNFSWDAAVANLVSIYQSSKEPLFEQEHAANV